MRPDHRPIAVFDSGVGGLTVMKAIQQHLPYEDILYFADTARIPYGNKSQDTLRRYMDENIQFLLSFDPKVIVIACHTASSALSSIPNIIYIHQQGISALQAQFDPSSMNNIAILGTRATIASSVYQNACKSSFPHANIFPIACPLFVPLIEEGYFSHPLTELAVTTTLQAIKSEPIDALLLGCTHYPLIRNQIVTALPQTSLIIDPAATCADQVASQIDLASPRTPRYRFYVSEDAEKFRSHARLFLQFPIEELYLT